MRTAIGIFLTYAMIYLGGVLAMPDKAERDTYHYVGIIMVVFGGMLPAIWRRSDGQ